MKRILHSLQGPIQIPGHGQLRREKTVIAQTGSKDPRHLLDRRLRPDKQLRPDRIIPIALLHLLEATVVTQALAGQVARAQARQEVLREAVVGVDNLFRGEKQFNL